MKNILLIILIFGLLAQVAYADNVLSVSPVDTWALLQAGEDTIRGDFISFNQTVVLKNITKYYLVNCTKAFIYNTTKIGNDGLGNNYGVWNGTFDNTNTTWMNVTLIGNQTYAIGCGEDGDFLGVRYDLWGDVTTTLPSHFSNNTWNGTGGDGWTRNKVTKLLTGVGTTNYNLISIGYNTDQTIGGGDPLNISSPFPLNGTQFGITTLNFNLTYNSSVAVTARLFINGTLNLTATYLPSVNGNISNMSIVFKDGNYNYYFNITSSLIGKNSTVNTFFVDSVIPTLQASLFLNNSVSYITGAAIFADINITDINLWGLNITIDNNITIFNKTNLGGGTFNYFLNFYPSNYSLGLGVHKIGIEVSDSHTDVLIPDYEFSTNKLTKSLTYTFDKESWIEIQPKNILIFDDISTQKEEDRYTFTLSRTPIIKDLLGSEFELEVTSSDDLQIVSNSNYKGHIVSNSLKKWIDFENQYPNSEITMKQISDNQIDVLVKNIEEDEILFKSIGGLNVLSQNYTFYYGNLTEQWINQTLETNPTEFILNFSINTSYVADIAATFNFNSTSYTPFKVTQSNYILFNVSVGSILVDKNYTNISFYWDYNITTVSSVNTTNTTVGHNQTRYAMSFTNCTGGSAQLNYAIALNFSIIVNSNNTILPASVESLVTVWNYSTLYSRTFAFTKVIGYPSPVYCLFPEFANLNSNYDFLFSSTGYADRHYTANNAKINYSFTNITIRMDLSSATTAITLSVVDENDNALNGYIIEVYRYDLGTNTYIFTDSGITNPSGIIQFNLDVSTDEYQFRVKNPAGELVHIEPKQKLIETSYTIRVTLGQTSQSMILKLQQLDYTLSINNTNYNFTLVWDDSVTGLIDAINLSVYSLNATDNTLLSSQISTADIGILYYNVSAPGTYTAYASVISTIDHNWYILDSESLDIRTEFTLFGTESLFVAFLYIGTMMMIGLFISAELGILLTIFGMFVFWKLGFIAISLSGLIPLLVALIIVLLRIRR